MSEDYSRSLHNYRLQDPGLSFSVGLNHYGPLNQPVEAVERYCFGLLVYWGAANFTS
jgi:hypothetical protein